MIIITTKRQELSEPFDWLGIPALIKRFVKLYN
jgi:hypothetical protein